MNKQNKFIVVLIAVLFSLSGMGLAQNVDASIKEFLTANPGKAEDVKKLVAKYVKGGNYFAITESVVASKLLNDFKETFNVKE